MKKTNELPLKGKFTLLLILTIVCFLVGFWLGAEPLNWERFLELWMVPGNTFSRVIILWRLPRVLAAFLVGACLSMSGVVFQGVFRNPLAEPYLLGSSAGASVGAVVSILVSLPISNSISLPFLSFLGAWGATGIVVAVGRVAKLKDSHGLLLTGVAVSAVFVSIRGLLMMALSDETVSLKSVMSWMLGGVQTPYWRELPFMILLSMACFLLCLSLCRGLDVLGLGDDTAVSMGMNLTGFLNRSVLIGAFATAIAVSWGGLIGFIGLIVPHVFRWWVGPSHARLLLFSSLGGGALLMVMDGLSRMLLPPSEIPLGLLTALLGGPIFIFILAREGRN